MAGVLRTLNILDELAIKTERMINSTDVIDTLADLFILRGVPAYIRSDNGPEFVAQAVRDRGSRQSVQKQPISSRAHLGRMDTAIDRRSRKTNVPMDQRPIIH